MDEGKDGFHRSRDTFPRLLGVKLKKRWIPNPLANQVFPYFSSTPNQWNKLSFLLQFLAMVGKTLTRACHA